MPIAAAVASAAISAAAVPASPVASVEAARELCEYADGIFVVTTPEPFYAVGYWYDDFAQTTDDQVIRILS